MVIRQLMQEPHGERIVREFHTLDFDILSRLDAAGVWAYTIPRALAISGWGELGSGQGRHTA